jgi:hypothetical protein
MDTLNKIRDLYQDKKLIPFIGAGFPRNIDNFPDWDEFVRKDLNNNLGIKPPDNIWNIFNENNIRATEYYVYKIGYITARRVNPNPTLSEIIKKGKEQLSYLLQQKFDNVIYDSQKWGVYNNFIELDKFSLIYTTNWDKTLEDACENILGANEYFMAPTQSKLREYLKDHDGKKCIIKYHGDYRNHETIIATETDYMQRLMNRSMVDVKFEHDLIHYDFLFIGFSFDDIFIKLTLNRVNHMLKDIPNSLIPKIFMVSIKKNLNDCLKEYLQLSRITTISLHEHFSGSELVKFLVEFISK